MRGEEPRGGYMPALPSAGLGAAGHSCRPPEPALSKWEYDFTLRDWDQPPTRK